MELATDVLGMSVIAIVIGLVLAFFGYAVLRFAITLYGALLGFILGGGIVASVTGDGFLATAATWIGAIVAALVFGALAWAFYKAAIIIGLAVMGFTIGAGLVQLLWRDAGPQWLAVVVGCVLGLAFGVVALIGDFPAFLIILATALAGAETAVAGVLVLAGAVTLEQIQEYGIDVAFENGVLWSLVALGVAVLGAIVQFGAWGARRRRGAEPTPAS